MRMTRAVFAWIAGFALVAPLAWADTYQADASHTTIGFGVRHMVVSTVKGKFSKYTGSIEVGADGVPTKATAKIETSSIDTDNEDRDKHLRSADFFDADKHPEITFETTKVEKSGDTINLTGNLSIRGTTKEITLPVTMSGPITDPWGKTRIGLEGSTTINRKDYGLVWNKTLDGGGLVVGDEVKLEINLEAIKQ